jgi:hypothetical protein
MLHIFNLLITIYKDVKILSAGSAFGQMTELKNNPIAVRNEINNWGFILFFICFFIIVNIINNKNKFLLSMFSGLFRNKDRHNMFYETVANENLNKFFLSVQTILLLSMIFYYYAIHEHFLSLNTLAQMLVFLGKNSFLLIAFFLYKFIIYSIVGNIFFRKETVLQWNDDFFSIISLNGIFLFLPALIFFYVESAFYICIYFFVFYLIFNLFFIFYKIYVLFFQGKRLLLYFILYLCTQEIIPLYLVYRGIVYLITQKDTIWMQV